MKVQKKGNLNINKLTNKFFGPLRIKTVDNNGVTYRVVDCTNGAELRAHHTDLFLFKQPPTYIMNHHYFSELNSTGPEGPSIQLSKLSVVGDSSCNAPMYLDMSSDESEVVGIVVDDDKDRSSSTSSFSGIEENNMENNETVSTIIQTLTCHWCQLEAELERAVEIEPFPTYSKITNNSCRPTADAFHSSGSATSPSKGRTSNFNYILDWEKSCWGMSDFEEVNVSTMDAHSNDADSYKTGHTKSSYSDARDLVLSNYQLVFPMDSNSEIVGSSRFSGFMSDSLEGVSNADKIKRIINQPLHSSPVESYYYNDQQLNLLPIDNYYSDTHTGTTEVYSPPHTRSKGPVNQ